MRETNCGVRGMDSSWGDHDERRHDMIPHDVMCDEN